MSENQQIIGTVESMFLKLFKEEFVDENGFVCVCCKCKKVRKKESGEFVSIDEDFVISYVVSAGLEITHTYCSLCNDKELEKMRFVLAL